MCTLRSGHNTVPRSMRTGRPFEPRQAIAKSTGKGDTKTAEATLEKAGRAPSREPHKGASQGASRQAGAEVPAPKAEVDQDAPSSVHRSVLMCITSALISR